jgi:hypothetical protein
MPYARIYPTEGGNTGIAPTDNNLPNFTYSQGNGENHCNYLSFIFLIV